MFINKNRNTDLLRYLKYNSYKKIIIIKYTIQGFLLIFKALKLAKFKNYSSVKFRFAIASSIFLLRLFS